jgi:hypothetical protein
MHGRGWVVRAHQVALSAAAALRCVLRQTSCRACQCMHPYPWNLNIRTPTAQLFMRLPLEGSSCESPRVPRLGGAPCSDY